MNFSKSKYTAFWSCPKLCWLQKNRPEEKTPDAAAESRMRAGTEIGELAKNLFGRYEDATVLNADVLDLEAMIQKTARLIAAGAETICEAAFSFGGLYCAVDVLHKENGGYAIYEVKSTSTVKDYHCADVAYQKYVLSKCGMTVTGAHVVTLNRNYVRSGALDIKKLFYISGGAVAAQIATEEAQVEEKLRRAEVVMSSDAEPQIGLGRQCNGCEFWNYCARHLPKPSVFDIHGFRKKWECYDDGIISFDDVLRSGVALNDIQQRQIDHALHERGTYVDKPAVQEFLRTLSYPLYFLDFETMQLGVPEFDGTRPFEQIPFQYSLHYVEREGGEVMHKEFLAESGVDPRRALAERLCEDIPRGACTLAYHSSTESGIVGGLAELFPDLKDKLLEIKSGIKDMLPVFNKGHYYKREMGGSFSIKSVLPAVFPEMDYHNLEGVQNGIEAMDVFPRLKDMPQGDAAKAREMLLEYCKRDTLAMVMLWQELVRAVK